MKNSNDVLEITDDMLRAAVINSASVNKFEWVKEFVFSNQLEQEVALAGSETEMFLIDVFGEVVETLTNE